MQLKTLNLLAMRLLTLKLKNCYQKKTTSDEQFYPDLESFGDRAEVYEDLDPKMIQFYNDLFLKFKINNRK